MSKCGILLLLMSCMGPFQRTWAQGVDSSCPKGWKAAAKGFLSANLNGDVSGAAEFIRPVNRAAWTEWTTWSNARTQQRISSYAEEVQARALSEKKTAKQRLEVSVFSCTDSPEEEGRYTIKVDPDGRSYQFLTLALEGQDWWVEDNLYTLNPEQRRVFTAYNEALDAGSWGEAEAWVARSALPRFDAYRSEVSAFLQSGGPFAVAHKVRVEKRAAEWKDMFIRAEMESDRVIVVHGEFPTADGFSSEMVMVDGTWRILLR